MENSEMILPIQINQDNPILRRKAEEVKEINAEIKQLVLDMVQTMEAKNGIGLAAPQVGKSLRIIVAEPFPDQEPLILINPEILKSSDKTDVMTEGCLSLPNISVPVERPVKIKVKGLDINGQPVKIKAKGLLARVLCHEIEHLEGILITDK